MRTEVGDLLYKTLIFDGYPDWDAVPTASIESWHWERAENFRPPSFAKLCGIREKGLFVRLWSFEDSPRKECSTRDEPIYEDSCLEFFVQLDVNSDVYLNFEFNCDGVYRSQIGKNRNERIFLSELTDLEPEIKTFEITENGKKAWGIELFLSQNFLRLVTGTDYSVLQGKIRANFYKCGDKTPLPHYGAFSPVDSLEKGFHNPPCFGEILFT
ncbi:MAG TPA: carbohydrate-binding family 9-like protein [Oscillospiraceae bacterium]|nr:carbohydrate-binding family 9-like protein [Oscillospiraceae bacterium]